MVNKAVKHLAISVSTMMIIIIFLVVMVYHSCEVERENYKKYRIEQCESRRLLGETNQYNKHLGCLRKTKNGNWEKVDEN